MCKQCFFLISLFISFQCGAQTAQEEVKQILTEQAEAWNRGDIEAFMQGYQKGEGLLFIGENGVRHGWQETYDRYLKTYSSPKLMGTLIFSELRVDILAANAAWVLGKWQLKRQKVGDIGGYFTLLLKKVDGQWKIVADHTS